MNHQFQPQQNPALDQLRAFVVPNKITDVSHAGPGAPIVFSLSNGGRMLISGNFQIHQEPGNHDPNVIDVVAKESKE